MYKQAAFPTGNFKPEPKSKPRGRPKGSTKKRKDTQSSPQQQQVSNVVDLTTPAADELQGSLRLVSAESKAKRQKRGKYTNWEEPQNKESLLLHAKWYNKNLNKKGKDRL